MSEWQPIETAPKDGTPLDLWVVDIFTDGRPQDEGRHADAVWRDDAWRYLDPIACDYVSVEEEWADGKTVVTHWMPLPEPPSA
jgi:hypothetical protein